MRTRWVVAGSLLTLAALALVVVWGGVVLAQQDADEATLEAGVSEDNESTSDAHAHLGRLKGLHAGELKHVHGHTDSEGHFACDEGFGPLAHLAESIGITPEALWAAIQDGQTLAENAAANGMTRQELIDARLAEADEHLALAAEAGILDQEQIGFIHEWMVDGVEMLVDHPLPVGEAWWGVYAQDWHALLDADDFDLPERLAGLFGLELEDLVRALLDGQALAEIAKANGVDPQTVVDFLLAEAETELDEALAAGYLTPGQAGVLLGWVEDGVVRFVGNSFVLPNAVELMARLQSLFGHRFEGSVWSEMDWEKWIEFDWAKFVDQGPISVAAEGIGVSRGELLEALSHGQSLAEIAEAPGLDVQDVVNAQTESVNAILDELAPEGLIPAEKLDHAKRFVGPGLQWLANHSFSFKNRFGGMRGGWHHPDGDRAEGMSEMFEHCPLHTGDSGE